MRICIVSGIFPPDIGGPATYLLDVCKKISDLGHKIYVITFGDEYAELPFCVEKISRKIPPFIRLLLAFIKVVKLNKEIDIIFTLGGPWDSGIPGALAKIILHKPMITKVSGDIAWERARLRHLTEDDLEEFQAKRYSLNIEFFRWLQRLVVRRADRIIVPSKFAKKAVLDWGVNDEVIRLIPNGIDESLVSGNERDAIKSKLNPENKLLIVTIGRLIPLKAADKLIRLLPELEGRAALVIIGDGPQRKSLELISHSLGVRGRVIFTGNISRRDTLNYLRAADLFVLYSDGEFSPFVILEAMSCGLPVVASKIGGIPELIEDGKEGMLIELRNIDSLKGAICKVFRDDALRFRLICNAHEKANRFASDTMVLDTLGLFNEVLGEGFKEN